MNARDMIRSLHEGATASNVLDNLCEASKQDKLNKKAQSMAKDITRMLSDVSRKFPKMHVKDQGYVENDLDTINDRLESIIFLLKQWK